MAPAAAVRPRAVVRRGGSQRDRLAKHLTADVGLEGVGRDDVDARAEQVGQFPLESSECDESDALIEVDKEVDVTAWGVLGTGDTAEDAHVVCAPAHRDV